MWWVRSDVCGMFSAGFTVILLLFAQWSIVSVVILPWYGWSFHFTNPGAVPRDRLPPPPVVVGVQPDGKEVFAQAPRICRKCKTLKPWKAHHCSTCGRCMIRMDHHCPWVNNCVAIYNQKYFLLFLLYTATCCGYCGILLVARFISCTNNLKACSLSGLQAVAAIANFIEAVIFGLFCTIMMWDQLSAIFDNTPGIDALQHKHGAPRGRYESLKDVFGEPLCWRWWLPFDLPKKVAEDFRAEVELMEDPMLAEMKAAHGDDSGDSESNGHSDHGSLGPLLEPEQDFTEDRGPDSAQEIDIGEWERRRRQQQTQQQQQFLQQQQQQRQRQFDRSLAEMHGGSSSNGHGHSHGPGSHAHSHGPTPLQQQRRSAGSGAESIADSMHNRSAAAKSSAASSAAASRAVPIVFPDVISYAPVSRRDREDGTGDGEPLDPTLASLQSPPHSPLLTAQQAAMAAANGNAGSRSRSSSATKHAHAK